MLRLRLAVDEHRADAVTEALEGTGGVHRIVALKPERAGTGVVLAADVMPSVADRVVTMIRDWEVDDADYLLTRQEVVAPSPPHGHYSRGEGFAWIEIMGQARTHSRVLGQYLALMAVAAVLGAIGVLTDNPILVVGAMAVSPDILPISAACVGIVAGRFPLARRAIGALLLGIVLTWAVAAALAWGLQAVGILSSGYEVHEENLHGLQSVDYSTILVALGAGVAAMLSFETRAASAVGVAISVTTIPASALFGVSLGLGEVSVSWGAAAVLGVNVVLLLLSGVLTLLVQRGLASAARRRRRAASRSGDDLHNHRRSRGRSSKSISTSCCQVPSTRRPPITGTCPRLQSARHAGGHAICVVVEAVVLVAALTGISRSTSARRSATPPGSNSIVVIAAVPQLRTNAVTSPSVTGPSATTCCTSAVMSMTSESPCVEKLNSRAVDGHALTLANEDRFSPE